MSATHAPADADAPDDDDTDHDPYGIVPEGFCAAWGADSIPEALRRAEQAPSTTVASDRGYCPDCGSVRIAEKPSDNTAQRRREDYECHHCGAHFDQPVSQTAFGREW
jgi:predicted RNA-binding Zn-ribbon protein involved in translation (DUF1610 family)